METTVIIAIITIIGNVILALFQLRNNKALAKEKEAETAGILIDKALQVSQKEMDNLREINTLLKEELARLYQKIEELENKLEELKCKEE